MFELLVVGWCVSCLLAAVGLVIWFCVELKQHAAKRLAPRRRGGDIPHARAIPVARGRGNDRRARFPGGRPADS